MNNDTAFNPFQQYAFNRQHTITDLFQLGMNIPTANVFLFNGLRIDECANYLPSIKDDCNTAWAEMASISKAVPNRNDFLQCVQSAENRIKDVLGTPVGPQYIEDESVKVSSWYDTIRLECTDVAQTKTQTRTEVFNGDAKVGAFESNVLNGFNDVYRVTITTAGFDTTRSLHIYPVDFPEWEIRPYRIVSYDDPTLVIDIPLVALINPRLLYTFPDVAYKIPPLSYCNQDNYLDETELVFYQETYDIPSGKAYLDTSNYCSCSDNTCAACVMQEVDICLIPVKPESGLFQFRPIHNTDTTGLSPCWEIDNGIINYWQYLHDHPLASFANIWKNCYNRIKHIQVNYTAGYGCRWGDTFFYPQANDRLIEPVIYLAAACYDPNCGCTCTNKFFEEQRIDHTFFRTGDQERALPIDEMWFFGHRKGEITAYEKIRHIRTKRPNYTII